MFVGYHQGMIMITPFEAYNILSRLLLGLFGLVLYFDFLSIQRNSYLSFLKI